MKKINFASCLVMCFIATQSQGLSLTEALVHTYKNSFDLAAKREQLKSIDEEIFEANSGILPQIMFQSSYRDSKNKVSYPYGRESIFSEDNSDKWSKSRGKSNTLSIRQNLFAGGGTLIAIEKAKYIIKQGRADLKLTEAKVLGEAVSSYFEVVFSRKVLESSKKNEASIKKTLQVTKEKFEAGIGTKTNVAMAQQSYASALKNVIEAEGRHATALSSFVRITGIEGSEVKEYEEISAPIATLEQAIDVAYLKNANFISAKNQFYAADIGIKEIVAKMMPSLDLSIESSREKGRSIGKNQPDRTTRNKTVAFQVTIPIYRGGKEYSAIRKARNSASASKLSLNSISISIKDSVSKAWYSYLTAKASVEAAKEAVNASKVALDGAEQEYNEGIMAITDLLDVQQKRLQSEIGLFDAQKNLAIASFSVKSIMGELTAEGLNLPVEYYDVEKNYNKIKFKLL